MKHNLPLDEGQSYHLQKINEIQKNIEDEKNSDII